MKFHKPPHSKREGTARFFFLGGGGGEAAEREEEGEARMITVMLMSKCLSEMEINFPGKPCFLLAVKVIRSR